MVKVIFLGTNGWFDTMTGNTVCTLVKTKEFNIILDAGNGISRLSRYADKDKPAYLFISHFHMDHVEGLHTICMNRFPKGLNIIVQENGTGILNTLMGMPFMASLRDMNFVSKIIETGPKGCELPFEAAFLPLRHTPYSQGIRLKVDGTVIAHCLDTGYCRNAVALGENADLLILECTLKSGDFRDYHLCPESCGRIALESGAQRLALTHFEGLSYPDMGARRQSELLVKESFSPAFMCSDGLEINI